MNYLFKHCGVFIFSLSLLVFPILSLAQDEPQPQILQTATRFVQQSEYDKALSLYNFYLQFQPDHIQALSQRAVVYASIGEFTLAFDDLDDAFASAGFSALDQAIIYNNRAQVHFRNRDNDKALADFDRAIELNPSFANYWRNRGILHQIMNNWDLAIQDYEQYLVLNPADVEAYLSLARIYLSQNDYTKTITALDSTIDLTPDDPELYIFRGSVNLLAEQFAPAARDYMDWLRLINTTEYTSTPITSATEQRTVEMTYGARYYIPFDAHSGDRFAVSANSQGVDSLIILIDPNGNPIMANDDGGQGLNAFILDFTLPEDGTYTLVVGHARGGWDGDIELTIQIVAGEDI